MVRHSLKIIQHLPMTQDITWILLTFFMLWHLPLCQMKMKERQKHSLGSDIGHWTMTSKKSSYVRWRLLHNRHICAVWSEIFFVSYRRLKTQNPCFKLIFQQIIYWCSFFMLKTIQCIWVKRFCINTLLFFWLAWDSFSSENILYVIS